MPKLVWDKTDERIFETGVNKGVLYPYNTQSKAYDTGVVWNGLTGVTESPSGAEPTPLYADNIKYLNLISNEEFGATVEAYTYPDEFGECNGEANLATGVIAGQQTRKMFGMSYQTKVGNADDPEAGYKIHLIYGAKAAPSEKAYATVNDSPEAITFSWELSTTPVDVPNMKPTACLTIDSTKVDSTKLARLEAVLYGTDAVTADPEHGIEAAEATTARLPLPNEVLSIINGTNN